MSIPHTLLALLLLGTSLIGCSDAVDSSPEAQIRRLLDQAEELVEKRKLLEVVDLISADYLDDSGRDRRQLRSLLAGYFLRHKTIHILKQVQQITLSDEGHAEVVLYAALSGSGAEPIETLSQWRGDLIRLELELVQEENQKWRVLRADWQRASQHELFQ